MKNQVKCSGTDHFSEKIEMTPKQDIHYCWIVLSWNDRIWLFLPMDKNRKERNYDQFIFFLNIGYLEKKVKEFANKSEKKNNKTNIYKF